MGLSPRTFVKAEGISRELVQRRIAGGHLATLPDGTIDEALFASGWHKPALTSSPKPRRPLQRLRKFPRRRRARQRRNFLNCWCLGAESNHRHCDFQSHALPTELPRHPVESGKADARRGLIATAPGDVQTRDAKKKAGFAGRVLSLSPGPCSQRNTSQEFLPRAIAAVHAGS